MLDLDTKLTAWIDRAFSGEPVSQSVNVSNKNLLRRRLRARIEELQDNKRVQADNEEVWEKDNGE